MRRLLVFVVGLCLSFAGVIVVAMVMGGRLDPNWKPYYDHVDWCTDRFCVFGIIPGVTLWDAAKATLYDHSIYGLVLNDKVRYSWEQIDQTGFGVQGQPDVGSQGQAIVQVQFAVQGTASTPGLTVGALIARFGSPCFVRYSPQAGLPELTLNYPFGTAYIAAALKDGITSTFNPNFDFNINTPVFVTSDTYGDPNNNALPLSAQCHNFQALTLPNAFAWRGFRSTRLYPALH